ncbi:unnamed protein product [Kluyveromyces dobzhanskii CBS 2104]|uniref:WGS project CCBQ000000000 data, contig 00106 n=1 Tax=Kluyveromyces dobzhanskii CBS 2104 TaxID=1427455 RepID=A0A0A8L515_9SACH|nr:unnamed protein product [Kluyveromyces dobzhanskii CBS 2104]
MASSSPSSSPASKYQLALVLLGANVVALGAGTPYMYSFYAPQLLKKCHLDIERSSDFSFAMSLGMSALGVFAGMIIDRSPTLASIIGAVLTFIAYSTLYYCYTHEYGSVVLIFAALVMVGFGSICSFYATVKCCTTNFPNHRGAAGAMPISLYALSGLIFSVLCSRLFDDDMESVFLFLTVVCTSTAAVGCFTLKIVVEESVHDYSKVDDSKSAVDEAVDIDLPPVLDETYHSQPINVINAKRSSMSSVNYKSHATGYSDSSSPSSTPMKQSSSNSLFSLRRSDSISSWTKELVGSLQYWGIGRARPSDSALIPPHFPNKPRTSFTVDVNPNQRKLSVSQEHTQNSSLLASNNIPETASEAFSQAIVIQTPNSEGTPAAASSSWWKEHPVLKNLTKPRFFAYLFTLATLQGIGQMYIFAVGFVVNTQIQSSNDPTKFNQEALQSLQVSLISVMSFCARFLSGPTSDLLVKKFHSQRLWLITFSAILSIVASRRLISLDPDTSTTLSNLRNISVSSILFGFAFGMTFGTFPAVIADSFGTKGFSTIWGLSTAGGIFTVKILSKILANDLSANMDAGETTCLKGVKCYIHTFHVTQYWGLFAASLSLITIFVNYKQKMKRRHAVFTLDE